MNCSFCKNECGAIGDPMIWSCHNHPFMVNHWQYFNEEKTREYNLRYQFWVKYKGKAYRFYFCVDDRRIMMHNKNREYFSINEAEYLVMRLAYIPTNITPENALQKLSTILVFS